MDGSEGHMTVVNVLKRHMYVSWYVFKKHIYVLNWRKGHINVVSRTKRHIYACLDTVWPHAATPVPPRGDGSHYHHTCRALLWTMIWVYFLLNHHTSTALFAEDDISISECIQGTYVWFQGPDINLFWNLVTQYTWNMEGVSLWVGQAS